MNRLLFAFLLCLSAARPQIMAADSDGEPKLTLAQAKAKFEKADKALNDAYAEAKKALSEDDFAQLRSEQRGWVEWRDHIAVSPNYGDVPGDPEEAQKSPGYFSTAADLSLDRAQWFMALAQQTKQADDSMTGHWMDSYGGSLDIVEKDGQIYFEFDVVRGFGANIGQIAGTARWNYRIGWFSDKGRDKEKTDEANISFVYKDARLEVTEANADYYHGHNAFFDGTYVKVKPLGAKEQKETLQAGKTGQVSEK